MIRMLHMATYHSRIKTILEIFRVGFGCNDTAPDFFLTLSPNDNWPHIQSTIRKGWGASAELHEFNNLSIEPDDKMAVGPHPLESVLGAEKRFSAMLEILLNKGGPLGVVKDFVVKSEGRNPLAYIVLG